MRRVVGSGWPATTGRRTACALPIALALIACGDAAAAAPSARRVPAGSFIVRPVTGAEALVEQVSREPRVRRRFCRIYGVPRERLAGLFAGLTVARLPSARVARVYYVHRGEAIGWRMRRLPAGTRVLAQADGTPVVLVACGNPLRWPLVRPHPPAPRRSAARPPRVPDYDPAEPEPETAPIPAEVAEALMPTGGVPYTGPVSDSSVLPPGVVPVEAPDISPSPPERHDGGIVPPPVRPHDRDDDRTPPPDDDDRDDEPPDPEPPPVPEGPSLVLMGAGVVPLAAAHGLACWYRRRSLSGHGHRGRPE